MREWLAGGAGLVAGGVIGAGGLLVIELLLAGTVVATLALTAPAPVDAPAVAVAEARPTRAASTPVSGEPGELQLITMAPVQVMVDGAPIGFDNRQGYLEQLAPGAHRVQILNLLGATITEREVEIASNQRTQLRYSDKALTDQGRMPMRGHSASSAAVPSAPVAPAAVEVEAPVVVEEPALAGTVDASVSIGQGPNAVEIRLPKLGIGRR